MNNLLNHYELNKLLKELLYNSFSFIKNISLTNKNINNPGTNTDIKKQKELYGNYLTYINSKLHNFLDTR